MTTARHKHKAVFLETFGCQMNVLDSELVNGRLRQLGFRQADSAEAADVILYNTCSVRESAEQRVYSRLARSAKLKQQRPQLIVGVLGCMAERAGRSLLKRFPGVDFLCGPGELDRVPELIDLAPGTQTAALQGNAARRSSSLDASQDHLELLDLSRATAPQDHHGSAYVRITRGCNKYCSYCVVPNTRGAEIHRPPDHIVNECRRLTDAGVVEITLLGQTVNHYRFDHGAAIRVEGIEQAQIGPGGGAFVRHTDRHNVGRRVTRFAGLLRRIHDEVPAVQRLRFVTSYPRDFDDELLQVMADSPRICNYLHAPVQSGSNRILKLMNRGYTIEQYTDFIDRARQHVPGITIASDFIVGFPTESETDFEASLALIQRCAFKNSFVFKYSPRPGTSAIERLPDDIPQEEKRRRNNALLAAQEKQSLRVHNAMIGQTVSVLVAGISRRDQSRGDDRGPLQLTARTGGDLITLFDGAPALIGSIVPLRITHARSLALFGELADDKTAGRTRPALTGQ